MIRAVLFDFDGTFYLEPPCHEAGMSSAHLAARKLGLEGPPSAFAEDYERHRAAVKKRIPRQAASHHRLLYFQGMMEEIRGASDAAGALTLFQAYWEGYFAAMEAGLDPQARPLLKTLGRLGIRSGLVTDLTAGVQLQKLALLNLDGLFGTVVTSEESGADKPDPAGIVLALERLGVEAAQALFVGDRQEKDGAAAAAAGVTFLRIGGDAEIRNFKELESRLLAGHQER